MESTNKLAVLIDADNAQPGLVDGLLAEIANYGIARICLKISANKRVMTSLSVHGG